MKLGISSGGKSGVHLCTLLRTDGIQARKSLLMQKIDLACIP